MKKHFLLLLFVPFVSIAQPKQDSIWKPLKPFVGNWTGTGGGEPGNAEYQASCEFIFNNNFIEIKNRAVYKPTEKKPKGEVHEDRGLISYDKQRKTFVLRQFHIEGFVNQYVLDSISEDKRTLIFVTESIENVPKGWRAREIFQSIDDNHWRQQFELAEPTGDFTPYTRAEFVRKN